MGHALLNRKQRLSALTLLPDGSKVDRQIHERVASDALDNIVEQNHQVVQRAVRRMLGFETFRCAHGLIADTETMPMTREEQLDATEGQASSAVSQFYPLAF